MNEKNVDEKKFETKIKKKSMKKILEISIMDKNETVQKREKKIHCKTLTKVTQCMI